MKITAVESIRVNLPLKPGTAKSAGIEDEAFARLDDRFTHIVKIVTDEGLYGIGASGAGYQESIVQPTGIVGRDPLGFEPNRPGEFGAHHPWEMAMFDLLGKILGKPVWWLFGGKFHEKIPVGYWMGRLTIEDSVETARHAHSLGFQCLKLKAREGDDVMRRVQAIHEAAPSLRLVIDANQKFTDLEFVKTLAKELEAFDVIFESPMPQEEVDWYRELRQSTSTRIAYHLGPPELLIQAMNAEALDCLNIGATGLSFLRTASIASVKEIPVWHASSVDCGIRDMYYIHAAAATSNCTLASDMCGNFISEDDLITEPIRIEGGFAEVPDRPGIGVELDADAIEKYRA